MTESLIPKSARSLHPRAQVQALRKVAQIAMRKNDIERAGRAIAEMRRLNDEHGLGYSI